MVEENTTHNYNRISDYDVYINSIKDRVHKDMNECLIREIEQRDLVIKSLHGIIRRLRDENKELFVKVNDFEISLENEIRYRIILKK